MHSAAGFAEHFLVLLKNCGTSGPSGPVTRKVMFEKEKLGTADAYKMGPVKPEWSQPQQTSGTGNSHGLQRLGRPVTGGTSGTNDSEQGRRPTLPGDCPAQWYAILLDLKSYDPVYYFPVWWASTVSSDADNFLSRWGNAAHQLGWTALDLFGVHPAVPGSRFDLMGLIPLLQGGDVIALTAEAATIRRPSRAILSYRRSDQTGAVLLPAISPKDNSGETSV
jgi:hypothetical protein